MSKYKFYTIIGAIKKEKQGDVLKSIWQWRAPVAKVGKGGHLYGGDIRAKIWMRRRRQPNESMEGESFCRGDSKCKSSKVEILKGTKRRLVKPKHNEWGWELRQVVGVPEPAQAVDESSLLNFQEYLEPVVISLVVGNQPPMGIFTPWELANALSGLSPWNCEVYVHIWYGGENKGRDTHWTDKI